MRKANKFISFLCSLALAAGTFSGMISVNAAGGESEITKGIALTYDKEKSTSTTAVIDVTIEGYAQLESYDLNLESLTAGVNIVDCKYEVSDATIFTTVASNAYEGKGYITVGSAGKTQDLNADNYAGTVTITFEKALENDVEVAIAADSSLTAITADGTREQLFNDAMDQTLPIAKVTALANPSATAAPIETFEPITKGIALTYDKEKSTSTTAVIDVTIEGYAQLESYDLNLESLTDGVNIVECKYDVSDATIFTTVAANAYEGKGYVTVGSAGKTQDLNADNYAGTVTITFEKALENDAVIAIAADSSLTAITADGTREQLFNDAMDQTLPIAKVVVLANPSATEEPVVSANPTDAPTTAPTEAPVVTTRPTQKPVVTEAPVETFEPITKGIALTYDKEKSTSTTAVIDVTIEGYAQLESYDLNLESLTAGVNIVDCKYEVSDATIFTTVAANAYEGKGYVTVGSAGKTQDLNADNYAGTVTITFEKALENDVVIAIAADSSLTAITADGTREQLFNDAMDQTLPIAKVTVLADPSAPVATETPAPTDMPIDDSVKVSDLIKNAPETDETYGKLAGIVVEVKKADGTEAKYGVDYVAVFDGKQLTADEFFNMINGYSETSIADVIKGLSIGAKYGTTVKASPAYQTDEQAASGNWTVVPGYGGTAEIKEETPSTKATLTLTKPTNGTIFAEYVDADGKTVKISEYGKAVEVPVGTKVTYTAVADPNYTFKSWSGISSSSAIAKDIVFAKTITVSATFSKVTSGGSTGGSTSGGSTSGGSGTGTIAGGNTGAVGPDVTTPVNFQDLDSVPWAVPAINTLVSLGVINGRSDTIFDPNASVTRAEFTKMVCAAFGIAATPSAAQTFTDVAPTDWFFGYVQAAAAKGIVNGVSDTAFDPNATIKRQEMAAILYRTIQATNALALLPKGTEKAFADAAQIDEYAQIPVSVLSSAGVINGVTDTTFEPYSTATRAQAACIIYQYYQAIGAA